jgi:hypothetical protein
VPRERLIDRAYELADYIMTQPRTTRRMTTQVIRRPWKRRMMDDFDGGFAMQMFSQLAAGSKHHGQRHIADVVAYVREGRKNGFD